MKSNLRDKWLWIKHKLGLMSPKEVVRHLKTEPDEFINQLPTVEQPFIRDLYYGMEQLAVVKDAPEFCAQANKLSAALADISQRYTKDQLGKAADKMGTFVSADGMYRPSGARSMGFFLNPFQLFSFYAEKHWAVAACLSIIVTAVRRAGFTYVHAPDIPPERVQELAKKLKKLDLEELRIGLLIHYLVYGNAVVLPHKNVFRQLLKLELLVMDRLMPVYPPKLEKLTGWDYWLGTTSTIYDKSDVLHLKNKSLKRPDLGISPLSSVAIAVEADMCADDLNYNIMHSGGMIGVLIALEDPGTSSSSKPDIFAKKLQQEIQSQKSGVKGANSVIVSNFIKQVHKLSKIGEFDASFTKLGEQVAKRVATIFKVPPMRLNIGLKSAGVSDNGKTHDGADKAMDESVAGTMQIIDEFINEEIIVGLLDEHDIRIEKVGRYGQWTPESASALYNVTKSGPVIDANDALRYFLGLPLKAPGDKRGKIILDNSARVNKGDPYEYSDEAPSDNQSTTTSDGDEDDTDDDASN